MYKTDDPIADFDRYDAAQAREEAKRPHCEYCEEVLWDSYYYINGEIICEDCLDKIFKHDVGEYIE